MRRIFLNDILHYRKQLPNETTALPTSALSPLPFWARFCTIVTICTPRPTGSRRLRRDLLHPMTRRSSYCTDCVRRYSVSTNNTTGPPAHTTFPCFRSQTLSHTGRTYRVPDTDPLDEAEDIPTQPFPPHDALTSREETIRLSPFLSTQAPTDATTSRAWSSRCIPRLFGLTAPRAHPETIGPLGRGVRSPVIYAPRNAS
jgi:hypothetical protein